MSCDFNLVFSKISWYVNPKISLYVSPRKSLGMLLLTVVRLWGLRKVMVSPSLIVKMSVLFFDVFFFTSRNYPKSKIRFQIRTSDILTNLTFLSYPPEEISAKFLIERQRHQNLYSMRWTYPWNMPAFLLRVN